MTVDGWVGLVHRLLHFRKAAREQASRHTKASFRGALSRSPIYPQIIYSVSLKKPLCVCVCVGLGVVSSWEEDEEGEEMGPTGVLSRHHLSVSL